MVTLLGRFVAFAGARRVVISAWSRSVDCGTLAEPGPDYVETERWLQDEYGNPVTRLSKGRYRLSNIGDTIAVSDDPDAP